VNDVLTNVSYVLIEPVVNTKLAGGVASGIQVATPVSMANIYLGAQLVIADPIEAVTVTAVTATTFTAKFANSHSLGAGVMAATFPTGQGVDPLFTQNEMLAYVAQAQNEYLLYVRCVFEAVEETINATQRYYTDPSDAIRIERISTVSANEVVNELWNTSQRSLDLENPNWPADRATFPSTWFQDALQTSQHGYYPLPQTKTTSSLYYSQRGSLTLGLADLLLLPDVFVHYLKYGVLMRCFLKDGEMRDPTRAEYCKKRFDFGVMVGVRFMYAMEAMIQESDTVPKFSPMPIPGAQGGMNG
jgi:hypothetical protein